MKKIPSLFVRIFDDNHNKTITEEITKGCEWVFNEPILATIKYDGTATYFCDNVLWKRYDAKHGKPIPEGAIKCQSNPDPITGHMPCWIKVEENNPADKWFIKAYKEAVEDGFEFVNGQTYELCGPHFQGNPEKLEKDTFIEHGKTFCKNLDTQNLSFESIKQWLEENEVEGIVFYRENYDMCKIKRSDFGIKWRLN